MNTSRLSLMLATLVLAAGFSIAFSDSSTQGHGVVHDGALTDTGWGDGKWTAWIRGDKTKMVARNADYMWFRSGVSNWRYHVKSGTTKVLTTPLTHPTLSHTFQRHACYSDDRYAITSYGVISFYQNGTWSRLPIPVALDRYVAWPFFDPQGRLWIMLRLSVTHHKDGRRVREEWSELFRWQPEKKQWAKTIKIPDVRHAWKLKDTWVVESYYKDKRGRERLSLFYLDPKSPSPSSTLTPYEKPSPDYYCNYRLYRTPRGVLGIWKRFAHTNPRTIARIQGREIEPLIEKKEMIGIDASSGETFYANASRTKTTWDLYDESDQKLLTVTSPPFVKFLSQVVMFRDAKGHYWIDNHRYDIKTRKWKAVIPDAFYTLAGNHRQTECMMNNRLRYSSSRKQWVDSLPHRSDRVSTRTAGPEEQWVLNKKDGVYRKLRFYKNGTSKEIDKVVSSFSQRNLRFRLEHKGEAWFYGPQQWSFFRWDGNTLHAHEIDRDKKDNRTLLPDVFVCPRGHLWMFNELKQYKRYNPGTRKFVDGNPLDAFAFTVAGRRFATVKNSLWNGSSSAFRGRIYEKRGGTWGWVEKPFGWTYLSGCVGGKNTHNGRMLVTTKSGVMEWDIKNDRWARLTRKGKYTAWFDKQGRRLLSSEAGVILMYSGDPFKKGSPGKNENEELAKQGWAILKRLNADKWLERKAAYEDTQQWVSEKKTQAIEFLKSIQDDRKLSVEVKSCIQTLLAEYDYAKEIAGKGPRHWNATERELMLGNPLLERMHPPMPMDGVDWIKVGMTMDNVVTALWAIGGRLSDAVARRNRQLAGMTRLGCILPDNTIIYMTTSGKRLTGTIVTMGMGKPGGGEDAAWDWDDPKKNNLKELQIRNP